TPSAGRSSSEIALRESEPESPHSVRAPEFRSCRPWAGARVDGRSVEVEIPDGFPGVRRFLGPLHRFLELLLQKVGTVLLRFHSLPEDRLLAAILLPH